MRRGICRQQTACFSDVQMFGIVVNEKNGTVVVAKKMKRWPG